MYRDAAKTSYLRDFWANNTIKVGYAGTTWRPMANAIWLMNAGVTVITLGVIVCGVVRHPVCSAQSPELPVALAREYLVCCSCKLAFMTCETA